MVNRPGGRLVIIGGAEDRTCDSIVLKHTCGLLAADDMLTVVTTATLVPAKAGHDYKNVFRKLGMRNVKVLGITTRDEAENKDVCEIIGQSKALFFTGGDQLRLSSILNQTAAFNCIKAIFEKGAMIIGTSAGASCMSSVMIAGGEDEDNISTAPGLELLKGSVIDQHFDKRQRLDRLHRCIVQNPDKFGLGIDENTAILIDAEGRFEIIGQGMVTFVKVFPAGHKGRL